MICDGAVGVQGSASVTLAIGTRVALMVCAERQLQVPPLPLIGRNDSVCADEALERQLRVPPLPSSVGMTIPGELKKLKSKSRSFTSLTPWTIPSTGSQNATFRMTSESGVCQECMRATSRSWRAVISRNVSTLTPGGGSRPDLDWMAAEIRWARAARVVRGISRRRAKKLSRT